MEKHSTEKWAIYSRNKSCLEAIKFFHTQLSKHMKFQLLIDFVWFDSLCPINNLSVIKGRVFLGWTSTKLGLMFLLKDTTHWRRWGSNPRPFGLESSTLPLSICALKQLLIECKILNSNDFSYLKHSDVVFFLLINVKMPTIVAILTFMNKINFMLSWVEHEKSVIASGP